MVLVATGLSGCCCFGDFSLPEPRTPATAADDPAITAAAREYFEAHARELLEPAAARQAADGGAGSCRAAIAAIAEATVAPVIVRGHIDGQTSAEAWYEVGECLARVRVVLRRVVATGAWLAVGAATLVGTAYIVRVGDTPHVSPDFDDIDLGSDELF